MPKTLLAVDDSTTMRKVLEITFSGEDYRVVTAENSANALAKVSEDPKVVLIDTALGTEDGYALCKEMRKRAPDATILLFSSRYNPYDGARGRDAGADDFADKPFDTQQLIDKVNRLIVSRESGIAAAPTAVPQAAIPGGAPVSVQTPAAGSWGGSPASLQGGAAGGGANASPLSGTGQRPVAPPLQPRSRTLMFDSQIPAPPGTGPAAPAAPTVAAAPPKAETAAAFRPVSTPFSGTRIPSQTTEKAAASESTSGAAKPASAAGGPGAAIASSVNGQLQGKLGELGLTPQQADAVMALSRDVVEKVVWEVVPQLAEVLIKEEIARLLKES